MSIKLTKFTDKGTDALVCKSLGFDIYKGKVQVQRQITNDKGTTFTRKYWVNPEEARSSDKMLTDKRSKDYNKTLYGDKGLVRKIAGEPLKNSKGRSMKALFARGNKIVSLENMEQSFKKFGGKNQSFKSFVQKNYTVYKGNESTINTNMLTNGDWTPKRKELHNVIIKEVLAKAGKPKNGEKPLCVLLGGGSASGKTTLREEIVDPVFLERDKTISVVDPDEIKNSLPEYGFFKKQDSEHAAFRVHGESSYLAKKSLAALIDNGNNFVYDGTMKSQGNYENLIKELKSKGYKIRIVGATVGLEEAKRRSDERALDTGRKVPHDVIEASHKGFSASFRNLKDLVDEYELYDTEEDIPEIVIDKTGIKDAKKYQKFLDKGDN